MPGSKSDIRVTCWNARGYLSSIPYMRQLLTECEILAISEHWVFENRLGCLTEISTSHSCFARSSRFSTAEDFGNGRGQGGIAIFWDNSLKGVSVVSDVVLDRACAIRLQLDNGGTIYFISVYLPAMGSTESLDACLDDITEIIESRETGAQIVILGDFNGDVGYDGGPRGTYKATHRGEKVVQFFKRHGLLPLNMTEGATGPVNTYMGQINGSTLDYIAVSPILANFASGCIVHEWDGLNTSDHLPVSASISISGIGTRVNAGQSKGHIKWNKLTCQDKFDKYQCILEPIVTRIASDFNNHIDGEAIDDAFSKLTTATQQVSDTLPHSQYKKNLRPFWNKDLGHLKYRKVMSYRNWVAGGRPRTPTNPLYMLYKSDKKAFHTAIKRISKEYEDKEVLDAVKYAEFNRNSFWKLVKTARKSHIESTNAIKRDDKVVVHEINEVLQVWVTHFTSIGTPKKADNYDEAHYESVTAAVAEYNRLSDGDMFLDTPFTHIEVTKAIKTLHTGKAPGFDGIMSEHIQNAGPLVSNFLCTLFNAIRDTEYIPICFKRGVQVPLYKGKDTCILDPNNYRGITLLPTFNKLFEILLWQRLKPWWYESRIISELQGACREGSSCVHTAFNLRETLATSLESTDHCFVAFYDVAKAFDTVWIDGLFMQLYDLGIRGKIWRLLYRCYINFKSCVKLQGIFSSWYEPLCGIHQGGFMSLMKYTVFINSLLTTLKNSDICARIYRTPSTPLGYADDVATCCLSKPKLDKAMDIVYRHGCIWRYELNAKKSGVLVYGESPKEHDLNSLNRLFKLGPNKVKERQNYDHVGIRNSIFSDDNSGIEERIVKGRRAFNAVSGIGIRKGGITMATCSVIFWSVVVPTTLYGCELWIMNDASLNLIEDFQNFIGKRTQRFHPKIPNICSFYGLGWMRLERIIQIKKIMFIRTIMVMNDDELPKIIFCERAKVYFLNPLFGSENRCHSNVFDLLNVCLLFGMLKNVKNMVERQYFYPKNLWREMVWRKGWQLEDLYWKIEEQMHRSLALLKGVNPVSRYLAWWMISDKYPKLTKSCEILAKIISHASLLKADDFKYKNLAGTARMCDLCNDFEIENARHFILKCPYFACERNTMLREIDQIEDGSGTVLFDNNVDMLYTILGRPNERLNGVQMEKIWLIILKYVPAMYRTNLRSKRGIG